MMMPFRFLKVFAKKTTTTTTTTTKKKKKGEKNARARRGDGRREEHRHHHPRGAIFRVAHFSSTARERGVLQALPENGNGKIIITFSGVVTKDTKRNLKLKSRKASRAGARARRK